MSSCGEDMFSRCSKSVAAATVLDGAPVRPMSALMSLTAVGDKAVLDEAMASSGTASVLCVSWFSCSPSRLKST